MQQKKECQKISREQDYNAYDRAEFLRVQTQCYAGLVVSFFFGLSLFQFFFVGRMLAMYIRITKGSATPSIKQTNNTHTYKQRERERQTTKGANTQNSVTQTRTPQRGGEGGVTSGWMQILRSPAPGSRRLTGYRPGPLLGWLQEMWSRTRFY